MLQYLFGLSCHPGLDPGSRLDLGSWAGVTIACWTFLVGACIGSFLNVLILRSKSNQSLLSRSQCPSCGHVLSWLDLFPVFSWIMLRGRCRYCEQKISSRYLLIELFTGILAWMCWYGASSPSIALEMFIFCCLLMVIGFIDLETWMIPLIYPAIMMVAGLCFGYNWHSRAVFEERLWAGVGAFALFAAVLLLSTWILRALGRLKSGEQAMGWGDPILIGAIGCNLGLQPLPVLVILGSLQGIVTYGFFPGITQLNIQENDGSAPVNSVPFGFFLCLATIEICIYYLIK